MVLGFAVNFLIPVFSLIGVPIYYESNWRWLLASNPEESVLFLGFMILLPAVGLVQFSLAKIIGRHTG